MATSNPLTELIPARYRKYVYLVAAAALLVYGLWEASAGDIRTFVVSVVSALVSGLAASNTTRNEEEEYEVEPFDPDYEFGDDVYIDGHDEV